MQVNMALQNVIMEDISLKVGEHLLNYRVSAVIRNGNKILVHHGIKKDHYTLPGGRVKDGESTITALKREIKEEMGFDTEYVKPFSFIENFFEMNDKNYHELLVTHELKFIDKEVYKKQRIEPIEEEKKGKLEFAWMDIEELQNVTFLPQKLLEYLKKDSKEFVHIINDERNSKK